MAEVLLIERPGRTAWGTIPRVTKATAVHATGVSASFAKPLDRTPGWVAVMSFVQGPQAIELGEVTLTYVDRRMSTEKLREWLLERVRSVPPPRAVPTGGISARDVRLLKVGEFQAAARGRIAAAFGSYLPEPWAHAAKPKRPGPKPQTLEYYARLAHRFCELLADGTPEPRQVLAEEEGVGLSQIRNRLSQARNHGLLTSPGRGRLGGSLTPLAKDVLTKGAK